MYQTQQQQMLNSGFGQSMGAKDANARLSQIIQRQSYPQAPITDRKIEQSLQYSRDSMEGARQGLQGAGNGGGSIVSGNMPYQAHNHNQRVYSGVTVTDRQSSIQFMLSQSDSKECGALNSSQNNFINVMTDNNATEAQQLQNQNYLQWSLTQSFGLDSIETESQVKQPQTQNFHSTTSFDPISGVKSEDYQSHLTSANITITGEHRKPIIVNSMTPIADASPPQQHQQQQQMPLPENPAQVQHLGEFDHILSSSIKSSKEDSVAYITTVQSPVEAVNVSPNNRVSSQSSLLENTIPQQDDEDENSEAEVSMAMVTVQQPQHQVQLPLPHELFLEPSPRESDQQPVCSANSFLPTEIFADAQAQQQKSEQVLNEPEMAEDSQFQLDALESQAKHPVNYHELLPQIDYQNLPIDVSNHLLLQQATSYRSSTIEEENTSKEDEKEEPQIEKSAKVIKVDRGRLEITQLNKEAEKSKPLILTDSYLTDEAQSSSASKDFNTIETGSGRNSVEDRQPELKPEELDTDLVNQISSPANQEYQQEVAKVVKVSEEEKIEEECAEQRKEEVKDQQANIDQSSSIKREDSQVISYLISRQTSQDSAGDRSPSLAFSQTNNDPNRMAFTNSMINSHDKQLSQQPSTSRKHYQRPSHHAQTSEKKGGPMALATHQHVPSIYFAASQSNGGDIGIGARQQSCSSFNNTTFMKEGTSCASRHSYFVNALGQRISSDVLCNQQMHPAEANFLQQMGPVQEFAGKGETMSTIPDETAPNFHNNQGSAERHQQLMHVGFKEVSAPGYPSTTQQSVTEVNFNSLADGKVNISQPKNVLPGMRQMTMASEMMHENDEDQISVKKNLNLLEAFQTQKVPEKQIINIQQDNFEQNDENQAEEVAGADDYDTDDSPEMIQSSHRLQEFNNDPLPVFKSHDHDHMQKGQTTNYSLEAQQNFYQRYKQIKTGQQKHHMKHNSQQVPQSNGIMANNNLEEQSQQFSTFVEVGGNQHNQYYQQDACVEEDQGSTPQSEEEDQSPNDNNDQQINDLTESALQQLQENHVTQEYFVEEYQNHMTCTDQQIIDDEDDIAVFRSQLNDIPHDLASHPTCRAITINIPKLLMRHQTTFLMSIEEQDPIRLIMARSTGSKGSIQKQRRGSRGISLSTYQATEDDNTGAGLEDRLSPKFEKLQPLRSKPSHYEHTKKNSIAQDRGRSNPNLMLRTLDPMSDGGIMSPPLVMNPTTKSFLHKIVTQKKGFQQSLQAAEEEEMTPASHKQEQVIIYPPIQAISPGNLSEDDTSPNDHEGVPVPQESTIMARDCQTTTNQEAKKRPSLLSQMYRHQGGFVEENHPLHAQTIDIPTSGGPPKKMRRQSSYNKFKNKGRQQQLTSKKNNEEEKMMMNRTQLTQQVESVPRDLQRWLSQLGLSQYGPLLVDQGLDDLQSLVSMMGQDRVLPLTHEVLEAAGIEISGHRARILVNLELEAKVFEQNPEIIDLLQSSTMSTEEVNRQAELLFSSSTGAHQSEQQARNTPDHLDSQLAAAISSPISQSPITEQIRKGRTDRSPLRPPPQIMSSSQLAGQLNLSAWLAQHNLLPLQPKFVRTGYECLRSLILQSFSQFNKLSDDTLRDEIGIDKIGHRMRILSQLRQDALVLFQMEMLYRNSQKSATSSQRLNAEPSSDNLVSQHDSLFTLPTHTHSQQQRHFKSVYSDNNIGGGSKNGNDSYLQQQIMMQHTQSQKYLVPPQSVQEMNLPPHHHMSQQQPMSKKLRHRQRNYSFNKEGLTGGTTNESAPSSQNTSFHQYHKQVPQSVTNQRQKAISSHQNQSSHHQSIKYTQIKDHVDPNINPWRHSTYFNDSRPVAKHHNNSQQNNKPQQLQNPFDAMNVGGGRYKIVLDDESHLSETPSEQQQPQKQQQKYLRNEPHSQSMQTIPLARQRSPPQQQPNMMMQPNIRGGYRNVGLRNSYQAGDYHKASTHQGNVDKSCTIF